MPTFDAVLVLSFGGPEKPDEVVPFLENVLRGRNVPRERLDEVAEHYYHFGGKSPINDQNRHLIANLRAELEAHGPRLPVYWGNRNWSPYLTGTLGEMAQAGVRRALVFVTSAFGSYSGCRQYLEDMDAARAAAGPGAPELEKLRSFHDHPDFIEANAESAMEALSDLPPEGREDARLLFTAHSIPLSMSASSPYVGQIEAACGRITERIGRPRWELAYQSRSGPPGQPWLEPDVSDALRRAKDEGATDVVIVPIGFISDHMEVIYDLDTEARATADEIGLRMARARTSGSNPRFIKMIRELIEERVQGGAAHLCDPDCCRPPVRGRP